MLPDLSNEETLLSDEVMETDFLSENQQIESQNVVVYKRASSTDMTTLLRDFGIELPTKLQDCLLGTACQRLRRPPVTRFLR